LQNNALKNALRLQRATTSELHDFDEVYKAKIKKLTMDFSMKLEGDAIYTPMNPKGEISYFKVIKQPQEIPKNETTLDSLLRFKNTSNMEFATLDETIDKLLKQQYERTQAAAVEAKTTVVAAALARNTTSNAAVQVADSADATKIAPPSTRVKSQQAEVPQSDNKAPVKKSNIVVKPVTTESTGKEYMLLTREYQDEAYRHYLKLEQATSLMYFNIPAKDSIYTHRNIHMNIETDIARIMNQLRSPPYLTFNKTKNTFGKYITSSEETRAKDDLIVIFLHNGCFNAIVNYLVSIFSLHLCVDQAKVNEKYTVLDLIKSFDTEWKVEFQVEFAKYKELTLPMYSIPLSDNELCIHLLLEKAKLPLLLQSLVPGGDFGFNISERYSEGAIWYDDEKRSEIIKVINELTRTVRKQGKTETSSRLTLEKLCLYYSSNFVSLKQNLIYWRKLLMNL